MRRMYITYVIRWEAAWLRLWQSAWNCSALREDGHSHRLVCDSERGRWLWFEASSFNIDVWLWHYDYGSLWPVSDQALLDTSTIWATIVWRAVCQMHLEEAGFQSLSWSLTQCRGLGWVDLLATQPHLRRCCIVVGKVQRREFSLLTQLHSPLFLFAIKY